MIWSALRNWVRQSQKRKVGNNVVMVCSSYCSVDFSAFLLASVSFFKHAGRSPYCPVLGAKARAWAPRQGRSGQPYWVMDHCLISGFSSGSLHLDIGLLFHPHPVTQQFFKKMEPDQLRSAGLVNKLEHLLSKYMIEVWLGCKISVTAGVSCKNTES